jgi:DivIVA domain-containing protein
MMFWFQLAVVVLLLIAVGWIAVGGGGHMSQPTPDRPDPAIPETGLLGRGHVDKVRFSVGARGYRMDEVDDVLDRLAHEIETREQRIAELEGRELTGAPAEAEPAVQAQSMPQQSSPPNEPAVAKEPAAQQQSGEPASEEPGQPAEA